MEGIDDIMELQLQMEDMANKILLACEEAGTSGLDGMFEGLQGEKKFLMLTVCEEVLRELAGYEELVDYLREERGGIKKSAKEVVADLQCFVRGKQAEMFGDAHDNLVEGLTHLEQVMRKPVTVENVKTKETKSNAKPVYTHPAMDRKTLPKRKDYVDYPDPYRWQRG